ncbi:50S ribosomal protein L2 [Candidatus Woesearchaeota archaeon]|nr:50S ribosomal protein L2 [Candidatus Woesearchaeota archaeon]
MGKNLIQQKRGKGSPTYKSPSFRYKGAARHVPIYDKNIKGEIIDFVHCQGHSAPLAVIRYENEEKCIIQAPEGVKVGDNVEAGTDIKPEVGNTLSLSEIPEGTQIYNIENSPGDGGKFCRSSGAFAKIVTKLPAGISVLLPSGKRKIFRPDCRAMIGVVAGSGRPEKPFLKAGNIYYKMKAKNKLWPITSGTSMNAVDHPFGGSSSGTKGRPTQASRNAPAGRKVGKIAPRRTGRGKK